MNPLSKMKCEVCSSGSLHASPEEREKFMRDLPEWKIVSCGGEDRLEREYRFKDFEKALEFTLGVGRLAEEVDHHPRLVTEYGKVTVSWWTHKIGGLHQTDFIMAARTNDLFEESR